MPAFPSDHINGATLGDARCTCPACTGLRHNDTGENVEDYSLDPFAGGSFVNKPIWDVETIAANLNRTGNNWYLNNYGELDDGVLDFGFWNSIEELQNSYYVNEEGTIAFDEAFYADDFSAFNDGQRELARESLALWDDLIDVSFRETRSGAADITFGNTFTGGAQAYAYLPFGDGIDEAYFEDFGFQEVGRLGGDIWVDNTVASNFFPLESSYYSSLTLIHELGHSLGLSHPGNYNATDDDDGDGVADPITYGNDAFYAQDSLQYTVMSYFDAFETGAQHIDWSLMNFSYASTPLVHDIAIIQQMYGADTETRLGDTTYGFNSTADRDVYDFEVNTRPILTIYDAGGSDTIDFSGWDTPSVIDLNEGAFSSGGGVMEFLSLEEINANRAALGFAPRTQATYDLYISLFAEPQGLTNGLYKDNISIAYGTVVENAVGGAGDDLIVANSAANRIDGGDGKDRVSYETALSGIVLLMDPGFASGGASGDVLVSIEEAVGSAFDDTIIGDEGDNWIDGGVNGRDVLIGGEGIDTLSYQLATTGVGIDLDSNAATQGAKRDSIGGFENVVGSEFADLLAGDELANQLIGGGGFDLLRGRDGDDVLDGGDGDDTLFGGSGNDIVIGGDGNDVLLGEDGDDILRGNDGDDSVDGGAGNDSVHAGAGDDRLFGGTGDDMLIFGEGTDRAQGGSGADMFVLKNADGNADRIDDFVSGTDRIDLSMIDADLTASGDQAFTFIGSAGFSGVAGELRATARQLMGDVNGDGVADFMVALGRVTLVEGDLVL